MVGYQEPTERSGLQAIYRQAALSIRFCVKNQKIAANLRRNRFQLRIAHKNFAKHASGRGKKNSATGKIGDTFHSIANGNESLDSQSPPPSNEVSQEEFVRLLSMHTSKIMSFIRILTMNRQDDAEEIFQLTCMILWQKFSQYEPSGNFSAWASRMAYFETLKYRESKRRIKLLSDEAIESLAEAAMPISAELTDRRTALSECIRKLSNPDRDLIRQRYFEGLSVAEISENAGRSTHAIYRELSKIHGTLSRCVDRSVEEAWT